MLGRDMKTIYTDKKLFIYSKCEKKFSQSQHLKTHERIHTDKKPFSENPPDSSAWKVSLQYENIHTEDKPFSSSKCDKNFSESFSLKKT